MIKVLIADDHQLFRMGIISLLKDSKDIIVAGEANNGEELYEKYFVIKPDLVLSDISMPLISGIEAIHKIKLNDDSVKVLFLSMYDSEEFIYYTLKVGGLGLVGKNIIKEELISAIQAVYREEYYFGKNFHEKDITALIKKYDSILSPKVDMNNVSLSPREIQTLKLISEGYTSREIAMELKVSKRTIDTFRTHLMQKLKLKTLPELIKFAIQFSLKEQMMRESEE